MRLLVKTLGSLRTGGRDRATEAGRLGGALEDALGGGAAFDGVAGVALSILCQN